MKLLSFIFIIALGFANAQTLAEMSFVAATSAQLNPAISLPKGSMRAVSDASSIIAKVTGNQNYGDWEV